MVFNISVISWHQMYWWRKPEKITDLPQITDKLYHIKFIECINGVGTHNVSDDRYRMVVVDQTDTIMTTTTY